jgi:hypothetical protein
MGKISIVIIIILCVFLLFIFTRTLPPLPVYNLCQTNNDCPADYQCNNVNLCVSNYFGIYVNKMIASASILNTNMNAFYSSLVSFNNVMSSNTDYTNLLNTTETSTKYVNKFYNLSQNIYIKGAPSLSGAATALQAVTNLNNEVSPLQASLTSLTTQYPAPVLTTLMNTLMSSLADAQTDINNLSSIIFSN